MFYVASSLTWLILAQDALIGSAVPSFDINLDASPEIRWKEVAEYYKEEMIYLFKTVNDDVRRKIDDVSLQDWLESVKYDDEHLAEMQGMVNTVDHPYVSLDVFKIFNTIYELQSPVFCSSTLETFPNGTVLHGRNMDYALHFNMSDGRTLNLPDITFDVTFHRNGVPLIVSTTWPGVVGIHTAMRLGGYTIDQQTRHINKWQPNLLAAKQGGQPFMTALRKIMESTPSFAEAVDRVYNFSFMAPQYFVMSGSGLFEGAVLTIDALGQHPPESPPIQLLAQDGGWHLVQTNDDPLHAAADLRRPTANAILNSMSQVDVSLEHVTKFMHTPPLFSPATVFTTVMVPSSGYYKTYLPNEPPFGALSIQAILPALQAALRGGSGISLSGQVTHKVGNASRASDAVVHKSGLHRNLLLSRRGHAQVLQ